MTIQYIQGDLLTTTAPIIAHGVNCRGVFGAGVAKAIAGKWPQARNAYLAWFHKHGLAPGDVVTLDVGGGQTIAHCATQREYMPRGRDHFAYDQWQHICAWLRTFMSFKGVTQIAMPKIGAGLAGGDWSRIEPVIADEFADVNVSIYVL